jgi:hypothetical protein
MRATSATLLASVLLLFSVARLTADAQGLTREEFVARYGVLNGPSEAPSPGVPRASPPRVETGERFDETGAAAHYRYAPSISGMVDVFRERAAGTLSPPRNPREVQRAIDETFGASQLGRGFRLIRSSNVSTGAAGTIDLVDFTFGSQNVGQALVGRPSNPNGVLLVALHGCLTSPDDVMSETSSYVNAFGLRALERGYTVVAPYVLSACMWIPNADWIGSLSGVSVFGYELSKIEHVSKWAGREYKLERSVIWGISLGGQYAMLSSALHPRTFDVTVISGAAADYEASYRKAFEAVGLDGSAAKTLGANTQVNLSARVARRDVVASILPRRIVFEVSTTELDFSTGAVNFIDYVDRAARRTGAPRPAVVLFEGTHETHPRETLRILDQFAR